MPSKSLVSSMPLLIFQKYRLDHVLLKIIPWLPTGFRIQVQIMWQSSSHTFWCSPIRLRALGGKGMSCSPFYLRCLVEHQEHCRCSKNVECNQSIHRSTATSTMLNWNVITQKIPNVEPTKQDFVQDSSFPFFVSNLGGGYAYNSESGF